MAFKRISVTRESPSGRNTRFKDNVSGIEMTRADLVNRINGGEYDKYHVRRINGKDTPVSNPDHSTNNNLD